MLVELTTPEGHKFLYESLVTIHGRECPLNEMTPEQQEFVATTINVNAMNIAYAGERVYYADFPSA